MNKATLMTALMDRAKLSKREADQLISLVVDSMADAFAKGQRIEIRGFGSIAVRSYGSYVGRNPKTGKEINIAPKKLPFFKPGKDLLVRVNSNDK
ncbi:integration host factor subunit beta [bacterium]|nr:integration host factor subunit beta [bacterium]